MSTSTSSSNSQQWGPTQASFSSDRSAGDSAFLVRLQSREREIKALKDEIDKLRENEERNHVKIKALERKIEELETEKRLLKEQVNLQSSELDLVKKRVDALEEVQVSLLLATMCDEIQNMMFKRIFPQRFNSKIQRKVKDIEDMLRTSGDGEKRKWALLQDELNWKYCHFDAVRSLKRVRNTRAHPVAKLTEEALKESVLKMTEEHFFEEDDNWLSVEVVNELITMWKHLKEKH
ncbi:unnamed protein product [Pocillopora meandrina]|uniref:Uncharacterized protein n=1 Tax=Pocillopora meandrina TaxID=46732 RepID=A0AAU9XPH1_9CNID|nr:unnamed protein product [Pocillopora meandrina]